MLINSQIQINWRLLLVRYKSVFMNVRVSGYVYCR